MTFTPRTTALWKAAQAAPMSGINFRMASLETPVIRAVERILLPSIKALITCARRSLVRRFMSVIMLEQ